MARQAADQYKKSEEHDEQAAHQHKQTRRAMRRTNEKRDASCPPRTGLQPTGGSIMGLTQRSVTSNITRVRSDAMKDDAYGVDTLFAQITHAAPSASRKETPLLPACCLCRLIRDELGPSLDNARWITQRTYRKTHGINPTDCLQTHTYCPGCFAQVMETLRAAQVMETLAVA